MQLKPDRVWDKLARILATGAGAGLVPAMPGTVGSLWGLLIAWFFQHMSWPLPVQLLVLSALVAAGIPICGRAARSFGSRDPGKIVYDEFVALPWVFLAVRFDLVSGLIGFLLFRVFDIAKPWPVRRLEEFSGGLGIMADDMAAAVYAAAALWLITRSSGMN